MQPGPRDSMVAPFSNRESESALEQVIVEAKGSNARLFLIIEGLDEFDDRDAQAKHKHCLDERDVIEFPRIFNS